MTWRDKLMLHLGPGVLGGVTLGNWVRLLRENHFAIAPSCWLRALGICYHSCHNSLMARYENWHYGPKLKDVTVPPPLFLLGHWRSGTTHLHNLLTVDERFAFPNNYQTFFPATFLTTERVNARILDFLIPKRRPMDNIEWNMLSPQEDEFALCASTFKSPCMGWVFPHLRDHYDKYLTFQDVPQQEITQWQEALMRFLKKLTWKYGRPLVLKSPPHTCRIKLLLQIFPDAKFVHIHRNPFAVFPSSKRTFEICCELHRLQNPRLEDFDEWILRQYRQMYDVFFAERGLIPKANLHEVCYEELELNPMGEVRGIYEALNLPDFERVEPALRRYVDSLAGYKKNEFPELPAALRSQIATRWRPCFEEWGY